jgi:hypothetical protein
MLVKLTPGRVWHNSVDKIKQELMRQTLSADTYELCQWVAKIDPGLTTKRRPKELLSSYCYFDLNIGPHYIPVSKAKQQMKRKCFRFTKYFHQHSS